MPEIQLVSYFKYVAKSVLLSSALCVSCQVRLCCHCGSQGKADRGLEPHKDWDETEDLLEESVASSYCN